MEANKNLRFAYEMIDYSKVDEIVKQIESNDLEEFCYVHSSTYYDFDQKKILKALSKTTELKKVSLVKISLTRKEIKYIFKLIHNNKKLKKLDISENYFHDIDVDEFCNAIKNHPTLEKLDISYCSFDTKNLYQIVHSLEVNSTLQKLQMDGNYIGNGHDIIKSFFASKNLYHLSLITNSFNDIDDIINIINSGPSFEKELWISFNPDSKYNVFEFVENILDNCCVKIMKSGMKYYLKITCGE